jgi:hypothetical protein
LAPLSSCKSSSPFSPLFLPSQFSTPIGSESLGGGGPSSINNINVVGLPQIQWSFQPSIRSPSLNFESIPSVRQTSSVGQQQSTIFCPFSPSSTSILPTLPYLSPLYSPKCLPKISKYTVQNFGQVQRRGGQSTDIGNIVTPATIIIQFLPILITITTTTMQCASSS